MFLIVSSSLHPNSRSRLLAGEVRNRLTSASRDVELFDLSQRPLPPCDGAMAYGDPAVIQLSESIRQAEAIFIASPVYNYDLNSAIKNVVELTGKAWTGKTVAFLLAAGGQGSYMSAMGLANSLMLDFRCMIVPRFVYATGDAFEGSSLADENIMLRVNQLVEDTVRIADALRG